MLSADRLVNGLTSEERRGALSSAVSYRPLGAASSRGPSPPSSSSALQVGEALTLFLCLPSISLLCLQQTGSWPPGREPVYGVHSLV